MLNDFAILDGPELDQPLLLAARCRHAISELSVHELASGAQLGKVELPGLGSVGGLSERPEGGHEAWFGYTDYATPGLVLRYDASAGSVQVWQRAPGSCRHPGRCGPSRSPFASADGTTVRMVVISRRPADAQAVDSDGRDRDRAPFPPWHGRPSSTDTAASTSA